MSGKLAIAGLAAGVLMYVWTFMAHMFLGLGTMGFSQMPPAGEPAAIAAMKAGTGDKDGLYIFPGLTGQDQAAMKAHEEKVKTSPSGLLLYHPAPGKGMEPRQLIVEFLLELVESLIAVWLISKTGLSGFGGRVAGFAAIGVLAAMTTNASNWLWYGFPQAFSIAAMVTEFGKYLFAGVAAALVLGMKPKAAEA
jgi:hypothetical protein